MIKKEKIDPLVGNKMYEISNYLKDLNSYGQIKCGRQNNYGHATIHEIKKGCVIRVHHNFDNTLSIDLLITPTALIKHQLACDNAIDSFNHLFKPKPKEDKNYIIFSRPNEPHLNYSIEVTLEKSEEIFKKLQKIKLNYS